ncbi:hypothetical protein TI39_contig614g00008 [Zymoseptoria brevis]|uniref:Uncharacterized protein n=1 Tax=Zymoseptoria brevis TaxID=1047168 RepID=A0A0F4GK56_9PEZI|nr:hypothetical protein TI39_contig614g00008 [Zymoseptoria brevis]
MAALRKTFKYPTESPTSSDSELDEEHQERLITTLRTEDAARNTLYRRLFLALPLLSASSYLYAFVTASLARQRLIALLSLSSLACTAYILEFMPLETPDKKGKRAVWRVEAAKGPLERYLVWLNAGLVALLEVAALLSWRRGGMEDAWRESLAGIVFALAMFARWQLAPLDLEELQQARYELKGA